MAEKEKAFRKLIILPLAFLGAYLYRLRGGGPGLNLPRPIDQILFNLFPCFFLTGYAFYFYPGAIFNFNWFVFSLCAAGWLAANGIALAVQCTGHGGFMDLGTWKEPRKDERLEFIIKPLKDKISEYWYDVIGQALTGFLVTLWPGLFLFALGYYQAGAFLALAGLLKVPAYMLGRKCFQNTESGEWLTGGFIWGAAGLIYAFLM